MVAYSFHPRFVDAIEAGRKRQTIRAPRKRHARPGEQLQLYTGMRTMFCRRLLTPICVAVEPIDIDFDVDDGITAIRVAGIPVDDLDAFAVSDGFEGRNDRPWLGSPRLEISEFWAQAHGCRPFSGVLIRW